MRIIFVTLLVVSVSLMGCQRGARLSKASNVEQPGVGQPEVVGEGIPTADPTCMDKCRAKADEKYAKCTKSGDADACNEAQLEDFLACNNSCAID